MENGSEHDLFMCVAHRLFCNVLRWMIEYKIYRFCLIAGVIVYIISTSRCERSRNRFYVVGGRGVFDSLFCFFGSIVCIS